MDESLAPPKVIFEPKIVSYNCKECGCGSFLFWSIDEKVHTSCTSCGYITDLEKLLKDMKEQRELKEGPK